MAIFNRDIEISHLYDSLTNIEIYNTEVVTILYGFHKTLQINSIKNITIYFDNIAVLHILANRSAKSSITTFKTIR